MSTIALRRMRIWLVFLTTTILFIVIAQYIYAAIRLKSYLRLDWEDGVVIASVPILFFSYLYALKSTRPLKLHKFLRAFLMLIPTALNMYVNFHYLATYLRLTSADNNPTAKPEERFQCEGSPACSLTWSLVFMSIIMDFFVLCEVVMTLVWGSLVGKGHQFGGVGGGYAQDANVIVVSPDQPQQVLPQQGYYGQQQQQQAYYPVMQQQAPILQQPLSQQQQLCHQSVALDPNPQYQQQQFQQQLPPQQLYHYPTVSGVPTTTASVSYSTASVPYSTASYSQSPVTTFVGYQPPPQQVSSSNPQYYPSQSTSQ
ncbi:MAG: hypothetical protein JOS17DRAFT_729389 [Linnemannia elongata]|nr:MAG: hypothetical protein JOS17DRAFT_729389 [Linnemannia elongata]